MSDTQAGTRPAALYLDLEGLDVSPGHALLHAHGIDVLTFADEPGEEDVGRVVALMVGYDEVGPELLDRLPALRLVATHSAGFDMVDVAAVRERGLWLANLPGGATDEVAAHALAMALALLRRLPAYDQDVRQGRWTSEAVPLPRVPKDLTLGVVGMGRIGQAVAALCAGVFGEVAGYDPQPPDASWPNHVAREGTIDGLFSRSDCVSLHLPLTEETHHLVDARTLALLPEGAVLVNVSRGELVDEAALLAALAGGRLAGAACDVLAHEPPAPGDPMLTAAGVLLTPHVAFLSAGSLRRYAEVPAANVIALLEQGAPLNPVVRPTAPAVSSAP